MTDDVAPEPDPSAETEEPVQTENPPEKVQPYVRRTHFVFAAIFLIIGVRILWLLCRLPDEITSPTTALLAGGGVITTATYTVLRWTEKGLSTIAPLFGAVLLAFGGLVDGGLRPLNLWLTDHANAPDLSGNYDGWSLALVVAGFFLVFVGYLSGGSSVWIWQEASWGHDANQAADRTVARIRAAGALIRDMALTLFGIAAIITLLVLILVCFTV